MKFKTFIWFSFGGWAYVGRTSSLSGNTGIWFRSRRCLCGWTEKSTAGKIPVECRKFILDNLQSKLVISRGLYWKSKQTEMRKLRSQLPNRFDGKILLRPSFISNEHNILKLELHNLKVRNLFQYIVYYQCFTKLSRANSASNSIHLVPHTGHSYCCFCFGFFLTCVTISID